MKLDPVLLEILSHKVVAAADQMSSALQRASRSTYVKEASDYGVALIDRQGQVFGRSDELAAYPASKKIGPWDMGATILHLMGIDPTSTFTDRRGDSRPVCRGHVVEEWI